MRDITATYRLQLHRDFRLRDVVAWVPYFHELGISHLYLSPLARARQGSRHGYDVTDPRVLNPELGLPEDFAALVGALRERGMGIVLDLVPNHMAASMENPWWVSVLALGPASPYATWFDIDWSPDGEHGRRVILPVLGSRLEEAVHKGHLRLDFGEFGFIACYFEHRFPLSLTSYPTLLRLHRAALRLTLDRSHPAWATLRAIVRRLRLPGSMQAQATLDATKQQLWTLYGSCEPFKRWIEANLRFVEESPRRLLALMRRQHYVLAFWRQARANYRRFFTINDLVGFRVEAPEAFAASHALVQAWIGADQVDGLRIDHIDGLYAPSAYLHRLRAQAMGAEPQRRLWVEKILAPDEALPASWPVDGTTGYEFLNWLTRLQIDADGWDRMRRIYQRFTGRRADFEAVLLGKKRQILASHFAGEVRRLAERAAKLSAGAGQNFSREELETALMALTTRLRVYRTYTEALNETGRPAVLAADRAAIQTAAAAAGGGEAVQWLAGMLSGAPDCALPDTAGPEWLDCIQTWQQFTGPVMAKGQEDSAFYVHYPLASVNEVGSDPSLGPLAIEGFHALMGARGGRGLNTTSTHDTKRSEDARARLNILVEIPGEWELCLRRWTRWNRARRRLVRRRPVPGSNTEYHFYQTLVAAWPLQEAAWSSSEAWQSFCDRIVHYMLKAVREAKVHTRWTRPDAAYETALTAFIRECLDPAISAAFLADMDAFGRRLAPAAALNSLTQVVLRSTSPGIPDCYQGQELWDLSLVDPDNRRPVEMALRRDFLGEVAPAAELIAGWRSGRLKLFVLQRLLRLRRRHPELFAAGAYLPLAVTGEQAQRVLAFARRWQGDWAITLVPLRVSGATLAHRPDLASWDWADTAVHLPAKAPAEWCNVFTGTPRNASGVLAMSEGWLVEFPVAVLTARGD